MKQRKQTRWKMSFSGQAEGGMSILAERMTKEYRLKRQKQQGLVRVFAEEERKVMKDETA